MFTILANPSKFQKLSEFIFPKSIALFLVFFFIGIYYSFFNSPPDYLQGETVRIKVSEGWVKGNGECTSRRGDRDSDGKVEW